MQLLFIQTAFIGDVILATSLVEKAKYHFPEASIDFLLRRGNESLLEGNPAIREVLIWNKKNGKYAELWKVLQQIRSKNYDQVINLQRFASTGFLTAFSGAKQRVGFNKNPFSWFFTHSIPHEIGLLHEIERNTALLSFQTDGHVFKPKLYIENQYLNINIQNPYICLAPTSVWFTKQFPASKWIELLQAIPAQYTLYLLGSPADAEFCQQIIKESSRANAHNLSGKLSLLASATLMQNATLNYVNDSAPMHLASAVNAPTCAIFCSTLSNFGFGPLADFAKIVEISVPLDCRPCGLHGKSQCHQRHFRCGYGIEMAQLISVLKQAELPA